MIKTPEKLPEQWVHVILINDCVMLIPWVYFLQVELNINSAASVFDISRSIEPDLMKPEA